MFRVLFHPTMNPPNDEGAEIDESHKQVQPVFVNHPTEEVEKSVHVQCRVISHTPLLK